MIGVRGAGRLPGRRDCRAGATAGRNRNRPAPGAQLTSAMTNAALLTAIAATRGRKPGCRAGSRPLRACPTIQPVAHTPRTSSQQASAVTTLMVTFPAVGGSAEHAAPRAVRRTPSQV
ncbi:hypothetical protein GCM10023405_30460 [Streptomonospora salina]